MRSTEIRERFIEFFEKRRHAVLPSASLVPENDPTALFITAGMQPLVPYLLGAPHPQGQRLANIQKCVRTGDIEDIGDATHLSFFEMLGNWSLGDPESPDGIGEGYFKREAIRWSFELLTSKEEGFGLDPSRLYITIFAGDDTVGCDEEAREYWQEVGIPEGRIYSLGPDANWWPNVKGRDSWTGPTGPSTEMFYDLTEEGLGDLSHEEFLQADESQEVVEIWNDVFMSYEKKDGEIVGELRAKNVDTGAGMERLTTVLQQKQNVFETDLFEPIMKVIPSGEERVRRVIADHSRAAVFLIADGVLPSNTDQGYILRRLIRRAVRYGDLIGMSADSLRAVVRAVIGTYGTVYPAVAESAPGIEEAVSGEERKFRESLEKGMKEFEKIAEGSITGGQAFDLFSTYGFPLELTQELAAERGVEVDEQGFYEEYREHQERSRQGAEGKFKGGLGDTSEMSTKYHTATHLLNAALREVLGEHVEQKGSNITPERMRFDFSHSEKLTSEQLTAVEDLVNQYIENALVVSSAERSVEEARAEGAVGVFTDRYGERVTVYTIGDEGDPVSKEICGGPHVENTSILGRFTIIKEESVSAGVRRIKAVLE